MIFLTIGTQGPFDRLVLAVDAWCKTKGRGAEIFGQIARPKPGCEPNHFDWVERLDPAEFNRRFAEASLIISHAGMGTIISALEAGKQIVVMPRRFDLGEHRNDHQIATVNQLSTRPGVFVARDETELGARIDQALAATRSAGPPKLSRFADPRFTSALRKLILQPDEQ
ncbi:glycosyltransferase [Sedimentitalea sp. JM2-8]|uniref:Glycosyltransferase n=1 Tax=Sedimentitalea xiamensis TaxID=3050037 RepID=A0ABT7FI85_9RHOB|nr:glycosyltransferase [Sedimentitalea xiamensis]MDK3074845.1 glycosyltransferase [Sedimentitalea xiamensis]